MGKPIWIWEKDGLASVNAKARSSVLFVESVLFAFVGVMKRREVGTVVSIVILYKLVFVAWLLVVSFANMEKLWLPSDKLERENLAIPDNGVAV